MNDSNQPDVALYKDSKVGEFGDSILDSNKNQKSNTSHSHDNFKLSPDQINKRMKRKLTLEEVI